MKKYYSKLLRDLRRMLETEYLEDSDEIIASAYYALKCRKHYLPVTPGQHFWYVCYGEDFPFEPCISKLKCVDIGWNKYHKHIYLKTDEGSEVSVFDFDEGFAFAYEESAQRVYNKQLRIWRKQHETDES